MKRWGILIFLFFLGGVGMSCNSEELVEPTVIPPTPEPSPTPDWVRTGWELTWQDEFTEPELDLTRWTPEVGGHGWGNAESQFYTDRPENAFIEDGKLVIHVLKESYQGKRFTSARLITKDNFTQQYGRFEARIQIPTGQGIWPAFWMLGNNIDEVGWPQCGEIDILENIGSEPSLVHGTIHGPGYSGANGIGKPFSIASGRFTDDFHVFAVEWEPEEIRWYVDDVLYNTITPDTVPGEWVYDHPFFMILNVAVGGYWPGYPDDTTTFPQRMTVDYVRVYERSES